MLIILSGQKMALYKLNIVHRPFHLVVWKFRGFLNFHAQNRRVEKLKNFVDSLYDYDHCGVKKEENSDKKEAAIVTGTDQSRPVSHTAADQSKWVGSSEEEEDLHVDVNFDEPISKE